MHFISTGGTLTCEQGQDGKLTPTLEAKDLTRLAGRDDLECSFESPYKIDSQLFDLDVQGPEILVSLSNVPLDEDVIITTGTDTINWLAALIKNHEERNPSHRKVVLLSSMYAPVLDDAKKHVGNIIKAGIDLIESDEIEKSGVFVASAQGLESDEIKFFEVGSRDVKIAKFPQGSSARIEGNSWLEKAQGSDFDMTKFKDSDANLEDDQLKSIKLERDDFQQFISGKNMRLLPVLSGTDPKITEKYCSGLNDQDILALEVGKTWFGEDDKIKREHQSLIDNLSNKGVSLVLTSPSNFDEISKSFTPNVAEDQLAQVKEKLGVKNNVFVVENIALENAYVDLAKCGRSKEKESSPICGDDLAKDHAIGLRYVPSLGVFKSGLGNIREQLPQNIVLEGLVGGVVPTSLLESLNEGENKIHSCGTYAVKVLDNSYSSSANQDVLENFGIERSKLGALDCLQEVKNKNIGELIDFYEKFQSSDSNDPSLLTNERSSTNSNSRG